MTRNKTRPSDANVDDYLASRANPRQLGDCHNLMGMLARVTGETPRMWGPSIVGYGSYHYSYDSGRSGEAPLAAFAVRGRDLVVYIMAESEEQKSLLSRLGKHSMGKSCLYFRHLSDLDEAVLEELVVGSMAEARRRYG